MDKVQDPFLKITLGKKGKTQHREICVNYFMFVLCLLFAMYMCYSGINGIVVIFVNTFVVTGMRVSHANLHIARLHCRRNPEA